MAKAGLGLTAGYAISLAGGVLSLMAYARVLGPHAYGQLAVYLAVVEAVQAIVFQWHRLALVRFWSASQSAESDCYLRTSHIAWMAISLFTLLALGVCIVAESGSRQEWLAVAALALTKAAALYTQEMSRVQIAVARYAFASLLMTVGATASSIFVWMSTQSMTLTLYASASVFALQSVLCGVDRVVAIRHARFESGHLRDMLRYGLPLIPVFLATTAMTRLDRPVLAMFEDSSVVGVYAASSGLVTNAVSAACLLVVTPCYPWLLREMKSRSAVEHRVFHARVGLLMLAGVFALCIALMLLREMALPLMLGHEIGVAAQPLLFPLFLIATIAAFRAHFFDQAYHLHARTRALMSINVLTLVVATVSTYVGARIGGCSGMIHGLLIANMIALLVSAAFARSIVDMKRVIGGVAWLTALAGLAMFAGLFAEMRLEHVFQNTLWSMGLSAIAAVSLFAALCLVSNAGGIRETLKGTL